MKKLQTLCLYIKRMNQNLLLFSYETNTFRCFLMQRYNKNGALAKTFSERLDSFSESVQTL